LIGLGITAAGTVGDLHPVPFLNSFVLSVATDSSYHFIGKFTNYFLSVKKFFLMRLSMSVFGLCCIEKKRTAKMLYAFYKSHIKGCDETPKRQVLSARRPL